MQSCFENYNAKFIEPTTTTTTPPLWSRGLPEKLTGPQKVHYHIHMSPPPVPVLSQSIQYMHARPTYKTSFQYYPPLYVWVFKVVSFPQISPPKPCMQLSSPHTCCALPITAIISGEETFIEP